MSSAMIRLGEILGNSNASDDDKAEILVAVSTEMYGLDEGEYSDSYWSGFNDGLTAAFKAAGWSAKVSD